MFTPAVKVPEASHEASHSGPITASTMPACIMRAIAAVACVPSQPTCSHTYDSFPRNFWFASATASEIAPADAIISGQESVGIKTASRIAAIDAWFDRKSAQTRCEQVTRSEALPESRKGGLNRPGHATPTGPAREHMAESTQGKQSACGRRRRHWHRRLHPRTFRTLLQTRKRAVFS